MCTQIFMVSMLNRGWSVQEGKLKGQCHGISISTFFHLYFRPNLLFDEKNDFKITYELAKIFAICRDTVLSVLEIYESPVRYKIFQILLFCE